MESAALVPIRFLRGCRASNLSRGNSFYRKDEVAGVPPDTADLLIKQGFAQLVEDPLATDKEVTTPERNKMQGQPHAKKG